ncbi:uncharacterized protein LOC126830585 [Patella vulgata]|uniref:uncharacterized protein LOC126830585 n=1 Tax=Patella vulgata TaxID=6465 RepID=UPI0024A929BA|nr:uncharacterized protein LOC126830585 [Patella vulgata]
MKTNPIPDTSDIITADGWVDSKLVIVANGTLPGPSIEVYEGQTVIVHVKNNLPSEATSIHWHGLHQRDTPWMDGVAFVTQCPIEPGQSFTYQFTAAPKGTFLYHSHIGVQRTMGLYGPFIIRERTTEPMPDLTVIAADGYYLKPATADSVIINPGERFDCTIVANKQMNQSYWIRAQTYKCGDDCGEQKICNCMYSLDLEHDKVYQLVFINMGQGKGWSHPVHMHGHAFYVLKMGYGSYNNITGLMTGENMDVDCEDGVPRDVSFCNNATWANASWLGGNVPGLELKSPPRKDTIIVPTGGYVVVRIKADNPGVWFMHCHIELHNMNGMAVMINESFPKHPDPPKGFPRCGNFDYQGKGPGRYCPGEGFVAFICNMVVGGVVILVMHLVEKNGMIIFKVLISSKASSEDFL